MADSNEMRALGIAAKFGGAFAKQGGTLDMMHWLADDPELMQEVRQVADRRLLVRGYEELIEAKKSVIYNPATCFRPGSHGTVTIAEVEGDSSFAPDEMRALPPMSLLPYVVRRTTQRNQVSNEAHRLGLDLHSTVDHLWAALLHSRGGRKASVLNIDGEINEFNLIHKMRSGPWYFPVQAIFLRGKGWVIRSLGLRPGDMFGDGSRFILDGNRNLL
jgi:hypothetical protein